ncbi:hypothetical protein [Rhizobium beringeri]
MKLKGIHKVKRPLANGEVRIHYYAWRGGPKMKSAPGTEEFAEELLKHRAESAPSEVTTLGDLIEAFENSPAFAALAQTTQDSHKSSFKEIRKEWPRLPLKLTQQRGMKAMIRKWHHTFADHPRTADQMLFFPVAGLYLWDRRRDHREEPLHRDRAALYRIPQGKCLDTRADRPVSREGQTSPAPRIRNGDPHGTAPSRHVARHLETI